MRNILSSYSSQVWCIGETGVFTSKGLLISLKCVLATGSELTVSGKLPISYINASSELCVALVSDGLEVISHITLGISLGIWSFGYLHEKVLVFAEHGYLNCYSFSKERSIRRVKVGEIKKITCFASKTYSIHIGKAFEIIEWEMNTGEVSLIRSYEEEITDLSVNFKGNLLAIVTHEYLEVLRLTEHEVIEKLEICKITAITWVDEILYAATCNEFVEISLEKSELVLKTLLKKPLDVSEILENSEEIFLKTLSTWVKYSPVQCDLIPEPIEKIDEVIIGPHRAKFIEFGLLYENTEKTLVSLSETRFFSSPYEIDCQVLSEKEFPDLISNLISIAEVENNTVNHLIWKILKEVTENPGEEPEELGKRVARVKERSLQGSPGAVTPTRTMQKRSVSPLNKSRKSITPGRMKKMQSDPKELIQLAVDTSSLLSSTQYFPKETPIKLFYPMENSVNLNYSTPTSSDFLTSDKKSLIKKLQNSTKEKDLLFSCIIAGSLGRQELSKAVEHACVKLKGRTGVNLNFAFGNKSKAYEILGENMEDIAFYSKITGKNSEFFNWIIETYEEGFGITSAVWLISTGYLALALQILFKVGEERLVYWIAKYLEGDCKNRKEVPSEFEGWLYELGPPRFKGRIDEELQEIYSKYKAKAFF